MRRCSLSRRPPSPLVPSTSSSLGPLLFPSGLPTSWAASFLRAPTGPPRTHNPDPNAQTRPPSKGGRGGPLGLDGRAGCRLAAQLAGSQSQRGCQKDGRPIGTVSKWPVGGPASSRWLSRWRRLGPLQYVRQARFASFSHPFPRGPFCARCLVAGCLLVRRATAAGRLVLVRALRTA